MAAIHDWQYPAREIAAARAFPIHNIVVPLDGSESAKVALPIARPLALQERATLHVAYVGEHLLGPRETLEELGLTARELHGVVLDQLTGPPADAIMQLVKRLPNSLIIMSSQIGESATDESFGSVTDAVLSSAPDRIILITPERGRAAWQIRRTLLAHDGTPSADNAIAPTAELTRQAGAEVIALHVAARTSSAPDEPGSLPAPRYIDQPQHEWPAWASEFVERMLALGGSTAAINFKLLVTGGQPGSEIAQFARDNQADLVVLPWHGRWEEQRSGAIDAVIRRSGCPVLLICTAPAESTGHSDCL